MKQLISIAIAAVLLAQLARGDDPPSQAVRKPGESRDAPAAESEDSYLIPYLEAMGGKLNFYFTLEDRSFKGYPRAYRVTLTPAGKIASIDSLLESLNDNLKDYKIVRNPRFPSVIHVIAKDLLDEGNLLNKPVSAEYKGYLQFFTDKIGSQFDKRIRSPLGGPIGDPSGSGDLTSEIDVNIKEEMPVRDALTSVVPFKDYAPFIWRSILTESQGKPFYEVVFLGPRFEDEE